MMDRHLSQSSSSATPHYTYTAGPSNTQAKRKRCDPTTHEYSVSYNNPTPTPSAVAGGPSWYRYPDSASMSYQTLNDAFTLPTYEDFAQGSSQDSDFTAAWTAGDVSLQESTPHNPQDASAEPPPKRRRKSSVASKRQSVSNAPPKRRRVSNVPSKRGHGSNAPPVTNSVLPPIGVSAYDGESFTPPTGTGSPYYKSFAEGSSEYIPSPYALFGEEAVLRLPSPGAFGATHNPLVDSSFGGEYGLPPLTDILGDNVPYFPEFSEDSWRDGYDTPVYVSATASGSSHSGLESFLFPTAPTPSTSTSIPPENGSSDTDVPLGVVADLDPLPPQAPPPPQPQLANYHRKEDNDKILCLYRDPFQDENPACNKGLVNIRGWRRHFKSHAIAERLHLKAHPDASDKAVALKLPEFAHLDLNMKLTPWVCELCGTRGRKSDRKDALRRHQQKGTKCRDQMMRK